MSFASARHLAEQIKDADAQARLEYLMDEIRKLERRLSHLTMSRNDFEECMEWMKDMRAELHKLTMSDRYAA